MSRCVLLIRGVNVGGAKKLVMAELRDVLTGLGLGDVRTVGNSGNAVFTTTAPSAELEPLIATALSAQLGVRASCLVRTADEITAVLAGDPLTAITRDGSRMLLLFTSADPTPAQLAEHDPRGLDPQLALGERVLYQWCPDGVLAAPDVAAHVRRCWGVVVTGRNRNTVQKLATLLAG